MTTTLEPAPPESAPAVPTRRGLAVPLALQAVAMVGIGTLLYPSAADWFSTLAHNAQISGYVEQVRAAPAADVEAAWVAAESYNARLPHGTLRDPFTGDEDERTAAYSAYEQLLTVGTTTLMGELTYERLGIALPIAHGTADDTLASGAGHLYGSSLPIGGPSTHSVLTAHSGLPHTSLFTPLTDARIGDTFEVTVLGRTHRYQVDSITTVTADDTESLSIVDGEDHITLITCTPIGINSHRLLVRGTRIADPADDDASGVLAGDGLSAGFPWWALGFVAGSAAVAGLLFLPARRRDDRDSGSRRPE